MKRTVKILTAAVSLMFAFALTACPDTSSDTAEEISGESPYMETLSVSGQPVWKLNKFATKISNVYLSYKGNHDIGVFIYTASSGYERVGTGNIISGNITFSVNNNDIKDNLVEWDVFCFLFDYWLLWDKTKITPADAKLNTALFFSYPEGVIDSDGLVDRQRITGTASTITDETILYVYAEKDCTISGGANRDYRKDNYYFFTDGALNLSLKHGWNMICIGETYGTNFDGNAKISMTIRNPIENPESYKWVLNDFNK